MNVQFAFPTRDAFLIESEASSIWNEEGPSTGDRRLYVMSTKTTKSSSVEASLHDGALEAIVDCHRKCLTVGTHWGAAIGASTSLHMSSTSVDVESLWNETAPLPPTASLSACFSLLPLQNAVVTSRTQEDSSSSVASAGTTYSLIYPFCLGSFFDSHRRQAALAKHCLCWESFLIVLHSVCFNDAERADNIGPSRFALQAYVDRQRTGSPRQHGMYNTAVWPEELLWKLLNSLVSCLAVYHTSGLHFNGELTANDVVCFSAPTVLMLSVEDTIRSLKADPKTSWSDKEKQVLFKTLSSSIALPQALVSDKTQSSNAFFVITRIPFSVNTSKEASTPSLRAASPDEAHRCYQRDLASVGVIVKSVMEASPSRDTRPGVSAELHFLVAKMLACSTASDDPTVAHLSALGLCQLQALRLRSGSWLSKMEAENYNVRLKWAQQVRAVPPLNSRPTGGEDEQHIALREEALLKKEKLLTAREEKLNVLMELYELTATQLDSLPGGRGTALNALRQKLASLSGASPTSASHVSNASSAPADLSAPLDISPVNCTTPPERSVLLGESPFAKEEDHQTNRGVTSVNQAGRQQAPLFGECDTVWRLGRPTAAVSHSGRRRSSSVYESEATLSHPSLPPGDVPPLASPPHQPSLVPAGTAPVTVELTAVTEGESDDGTSYSSVEAPLTAQHTPPRQRLSPAKDAYTYSYEHDDRADRPLAQLTGATVPLKSAWNPQATTTRAGPMMQTSAGTSHSTAAADTHTPVRPSIPSLGKDDLSSQSKYSSIYTGTAGRGVAGHQTADASLSSASRHLQFGTTSSGAQRRKNTSRSTRARGVASSASHSSSRSLSARAGVERRSPRYDTHISTGGGGRRSPRVKTDEHWIQHQYHTLEEMRRSFSAHSSATRPSEAREGSSSSPATESSVPQLSVRGTVTDTADKRDVVAAPAALPPPCSQPSPSILVSPVHTPSPRAAPWRTPLSSGRSSASQGAHRPRTAPSTATTAATSTTMLSARLGSRPDHHAAPSAPRVHLNTPSTQVHPMGGTKQPAQDGTMDLLQRLRATF